MTRPQAGDRRRRFLQEPPAPAPAPPKPRKPRKPRKPKG